MEDKQKQTLKGSESRDIFKRKHKDLDNAFYACDLDFVLVAKYPYRIVAFMDYKQQGDGVSFTEAIVYTILSKIAPVFIVKGNAEEGPFTIFRFISADPHPHPPQIESSMVRQCETWRDLGEWERELRG